MKTYQLMGVMYKEYFIEADSAAEAIEKMFSEDIEPVDTWTSDQVEVVDIHDGNDWEVEKVNA
jgi:hypothetical protein